MVDGMPGTLHMAGQTGGPGGERGPVFFSPRIGDSDMRLSLVGWELCIIERVIEGGLLGRMRR